MFLHTDIIPAFRSSQWQRQEAFGYPPIYFFPDFFPVSFLLSCFLACAAHVLHILLTPLQDSKNILHYPIGLSSRRDLHSRTLLLASLRYFGGRASCRFAALPHFHPKAAYRKGTDFVYICTLLMDSHKLGLWISMVWKMHYLPYLYLAYSIVHARHRPTPFHIITWVRS